MIYAARFEAMDLLVSYLTDHCCQGRPEVCKPTAIIAQPRGAGQKPEPVR
jgi:hypothetical protein